LWGRYLRSSPRRISSPDTLVRRYPNAFNTPSRRSIKQVILNDFHFFAPCISRRVQPAFQSLLQGIGPRAHQDVATGVNQADPIATWYFYIALQAALRLATVVNPEAHVIGFADAVQLVGIPPLGGNHKLPLRPSSSRGSREASNLPQKHFAFRQFRCVLRRCCISALHHASSCIAQCDTNSTTSSSECPDTFCNILSAPLKISLHFQLCRPTTSILTLQQGVCGLGMTLNSAAGLLAWVQIPVPPSATSRLLYKLLGGVRLGFLAVSPFRIACKFIRLLGVDAKVPCGYSVITFIYVTSHLRLPLRQGGSRHMHSALWSALSLAI
jgi:hypothetical protein